MKDLMKILLNPFFLTIALLSNTAYSQSHCQKFDGNWIGSISGRVSGPVKISIDNCSVTWLLPDGKTNYCKYFENDKKIEYKCSLGSHGIVVLQGKRIIMKNVYTGNDYVVSIARQ
jgi:hypothetical protein